ncbi:UDP-glucuronosyl/UDP-glucosyltransferase [Parasponia andersonii]|uniref:Glycosyltransferase n=1 Tax=Parasponia andersonii TaxID=3476 RepID=A0A2P5A4H1_PARAD|nr:UDP-glucuronosyl/UDP-glucosyltransferase [Parasponia andersonii]
MGSKSHDQPHFILVPLMSQGHLIPMVDMSKLLANHGVAVTIVTTPQNAVRFDRVIAHAVESGLRIRLLQLRLPCAEAGLPDGCENLDTLPSRKLSGNFFLAARMLQKPLEHFLEKAQPRPSCIISDRYLAWTSNVAQNLGIPRLVFDGTSCFNLMCSHNIEASKIYKRVSEFEPFAVPDLPDNISLTKSQLPETFNPGPLYMPELHDEIDAAEKMSYGLVVNTFEELEEDYVKDSRKVIKGGKVWCIGPVSLCNEDQFDKSHRGNKSSIDEDQCLKWLDSWPESSVVYACLGTLSSLQPQQVLELGLGLEASLRPFVLIIREGYKSVELEKLISEDGFLERTKERGLLIRGWAPQVLILSHKAIGGFLTHCGWNSVLEGVSAGLPMMTWPMFSEQFFNDKFVTEVLRIGVSLGVEGRAMKWGEEEKCGVMVKREDIQRAIEQVMDMGEEQEEIRKRAREFGEKAKKAMEKGGSSYLNVKLLVEDIVQQQSMQTHSK